MLAVVNGPREGETTGSREFHLPAHADVSRRPIVCAYPGPTQVTRPTGHPGSCAATLIGSPAGRPENIPDHTRSAKFSPKDRTGPAPTSFSGRSWPARNAIEVPHSRFSAAVHPDCLQASGDIPGSNSQIPSLGHVGAHSAQIWTISAMAGTQPMPAQIGGDARVAHDQGRTLTAIDVTARGDSERRIRAADYWVGVAVRRMQINWLWAS